jgi:hypothetical protein
MIEAEKLIAIIVTLVLLFVLFYDSSFVKADDFLTTSSNYREIENMRPKNHVIDKWDYIGAWCNGQVMHDMDCLADDYAVSFFSVQGGLYGVVRAKMKARRYDDRKPAVFFFVKSEVVDYEYIKEAKEWAETMNIKVFFGTMHEILNI